MFIKSVANNRNKQIAIPMRVICPLLFLNSVDTGKNEINIDHIVGIEKRSNLKNQCSEKN